MARVYKTRARAVLRRRRECPEPTARAGEPERACAVERGEPALRAWSLEPGAGSREPGAGSLEPDYPLTALRSARLSR
jgi:hypothetical protein